MGFNWCQIRNKTFYIQKLSKFYVEKGYICLKVSSLVCKCVFHRPEHIPKRGPHGTEF